MPCLPNDSTAHERVPLLGMYLYLHSIFFHRLGLQSGISLEGTDAKQLGPVNIITGQPASAREVLSNLDVFIVQQLGLCTAHKNCNARHF